MSNGSLGWFDEQIKNRKEADDRAFEDSFVDIAGAIMGRRLKSVLEDEREQAQNAVEEILRFFSVRLRETPSSMTSLDDILEYQLRPYGIMHRGVRLEKNWCQDACSAMLGSLKEGGIIALVPDRTGRYYYTDPASGKKTAVVHGTEKLIDENAMVFYRPFPQKEIGVAELLRYMLECLRPSDIAGFAAASLAVALVGMLTPFLSQRLFSQAAERMPLNVFAGTAVFMLCAAVSAAMYNSVSLIMKARNEQIVSNNVETAVMMRLLSLPASFFKDYSSGELADRTRYVSLLVSRIMGVLGGTALNSVFSIVYIFQIGFFAPSLALPALAVTLVTFLLSVIILAVQTRVSKRLMECSAKESGMSYALLCGIQKIKLSGAEKRAFSRWARLYSEKAALEFNPPLIIKLNTALISAVTLVGNLVIYYIAFTAGVEVSQYYAFCIAYGLVNTAFVSLGGIATIVAGIRPAFQMSRPILASLPEVDGEKQPVQRLSGGIELSHVTFRYREDMPPVLDDLSLKIRPGQYVAIVGSTGCGKSTLMRVMLGFETPDRGAVYYDGKDLSRLDLKSLRKNIGVVMQSGRLFSGDIYSNIVISAPHLTLQDAWDAAELAGVADDIRDMPMKMSTMISEGQGGISGGQRQRIVIARAIAHHPKILMFDEATSALDNLTQKRVSHSLDELKCTRIVIAHRLSTIKQCDRIIVLDKGRIIEDGSYAELMDKKGFFADLVDRQQVGDSYIAETTTF